MDPPGSDVVRSSPVAPPEVDFVGATLAFDSIVALEGFLTLFYRDDLPVPLLQSVIVHLSSSAREAKVTGPA